MVRVALIQQNSDPRKHDYQRTWGTLKDQTDQAAAYDPDLVLWSETAFVPNIRRWSQEDPEEHYYARLVLEFLDYLKDLQLWLVTGNDDYELVTDESGEEQRYEYNATVMFSPDGERKETYRKLHLVPFTEYFPYEKQFPRFTEMLRNFDVYLWEPGEKRILFDHPKFSFATPICYEDTFPMDIRRFVKDGAEALLTVSNDYWSLTEVEAKQHFVHGLFRAVENRVPVLKASASGFTSFVLPTGRLVEGLPYYEEGFLIADVPLEKAGNTPYTLLGDWFPLASLAALFVLVVIYLAKDRPL
jgi:apolipoprotein N-acyltransferase